MSVDAVDFLGGEVDRNYRIDTSAGVTFLAKVQKDKDLRTLQWQEAILVHLASRDAGVSMPTIVPTSDGRLHSRYSLKANTAIVSVHNWLSGTELIKLPSHSDSLLTDIGATSASITRALEGFDAPALHQSHHWDVTRSDRAIRSCLDDHPQLAGEPYVWTVFNDALFSVRVAEPAIAGAYAMLRKEDPLRALGLAVAGYQQVQSLSADELEVVYPLAVARLCVQVLTLTARSQSNPTEYGTRRMEHTLPTLGRLLEIEPAAATTYLREARCDVAQAKVSRVRARATRTRAGRREAGRAGGATLPQQRQTETRDRTQAEALTLW
ncbi:phosphotransferase [Streptomyces phaeochromogenes]|uniref:phosphotransferase n=1 Tax=Streptomyces phaeochromogenes TaxID=1923 RepID=UPI0033D7DA64